MPSQTEIKFLGTKSSAINRDVLFYNETGEEIPTYEKGFYYFKRFEPIQLNDAIHRSGVKFNISFGTSGKYSDIAATRFGKSNEFFLTYQIAYSFRNSNK